MKTYHDRLVAGLKAMGWVLDTKQKSNYTAFTNKLSPSKLFVGKSGALRKGLNASSSQSIGCPSDNPRPARYARILQAGDFVLSPPAEPLIEYTMGKIKSSEHDHNCIRYSVNCITVGIYFPT
jgi:hypothetical protein